MSAPIHIIALGVAPRVQLNWFHPTYGPEPDRNNSSHTGIHFALRSRRRAAEDVAQLVGPSGAANPEIISVGLSGNYSSGSHSSVSPFPAAVTVALRSVPFTHATEKHFTSSARL